jgi:hypothetical protein
MIMNTAIFVDDSGSTDSMSAYWSEVARMTEGRNDATYFLWNSKCSHVGYDALMNTIRLKRGNGGTDISTIYNALNAADSSFDRLVIITDGQVDSGSVNRVWSMISSKGVSRKNKWKHIDAHLVTSRPDTSVIAPFIDGCTFNVYDDRGQMVAGSQIATDDDLAKIIDDIKTVDEFKARHDDITARLGGNSICRNTGIVVREALIRLNKRMILATQLKSVTVEPTTPSAPTVEQVLRDATDFYSNKVPSTNDNKAKNDDVSAMISRLIDKCTKAGNLSLDQLRATRDTRHAISAPAPLVQEVHRVPSDDSYIDDITCDPSLVALVAVQARCTKPLVPRDHPLYEAIKRNPMMLLLDSKLVDELVFRLNVKPVGLDTVIGMRQSRRPLIHPETRESIVAFAVLGSDPSHVTANRNFVARVVFGSDSMSGSYALWMATLWVCLKKTKPFVLDNGVEAIADSFMRNLVLDTPEKLKVWLGLDGTGARPTQKVSLGSALLYSVVSSNAWINYPERDVMRELCGIWPHIRDLLVLSDIPIPDGTEERILDVIRASNLLRDVKRTSVDDQIRTINEAYVKTLRVADDYNILLDSKARDPTEEEKLKAYWLSKGIVSPSYRIGAVRLPTKQSIGPLPDPIPDLGRKYRISENGEFDIDNDIRLVNPHTLRPYVTSADGSMLDYVSRLQEMNTTGISMHYRLIQFYLSHSRFPNESDDADKAAFLRFVEREDSRRFGGILPAGVESMYACVLRSVWFAMEQRKKLGYSMDPSIIRTDILRGNPRDARAQMEVEFRKAHSSN